MLSLRGVALLLMLPAAEVRASMVKFAIDQPLPDASGEHFMNLTAAQRDTIQAFERTGASLSLLGSLFIFAAYAFFKRLRTVPNTFILFASVANVGASIACLIGYSGVLMGDNSALCQVQGFLLEMFMQSDPWWSLAMAVNVYAVFFWGASPTSFRKYLWVYALICFGLPAIPAVIGALVRPDGLFIYGNATLWCWIADPFNSLRIFTYYLPIWTCIVLSALIYLAVGYHVFHQRNQLRNLTLSTPAKDGSGIEARNSGEKGHVSDQSIAPNQSTYGIVTTEVQVHTSKSRRATSAGLAQDGRPATAQPMPPWHSSIDEHLLAPPLSAVTTGTPFATVSTISSRATETPKTRGCTSRLLRPWHRFVSKLRHLDPVKLAYLRTSFVFAISVLVTWTPSSINRVYTLIHPQGTNYGLNLASAVVLPLQGVWNCFIFGATSWNVLRDEWHDAVRRRGWPRRGSERLHGEPDQFDRWGRVRGRDRDQNRGAVGADELEMKPRAGGTLRVVKGGSL